MSTRTDELSYSKAAMANDTYEMAKAEAGQSMAVSVRLIEKRLGLKPGQLKSWRANNLSRKGLLFKNGTRCGSRNQQPASV